MKRLLKWFGYEEISEPVLTITEGIKKGQWGFEYDKKAMRYDLTNNLIKTLKLHVYAGFSIDHMCCNAQWMNGKERRAVGLAFFIHRKEVEEFDKKYERQRFMELVK